MDHLPIFMNIRDRTVCVVGGGEKAYRKVDLLLRAGARVRVFAPTVCPSLERLAQAGHINQCTHSLGPADLGGTALVIAASDKETEDEHASALAHAVGLPVNVVDRPALSSFIMPALIDRSPLMIAISSGGAAPVLVRQLKARLESLLPAGLGRLARLAGGFREKVRAHLPDARRRMRFWEELFTGPVAERVFAHREDQAADLIEKMLRHRAAGLSADPGGEVALVGAGPGDPDLLTFKAARLMSEADVVVYDRLVSDEVLALVRRDAERIYVGKSPGDHTMSQTEITHLLCRLAQQGKRVVRLKGGDPFLFGRGGEEADALARHGIPVQIVPGITAAMGCAAAAGIPLTHRDHAQACVFVTGHMKDDRLDLDWDRLARPRQTVAVYMGLSSMSELSQTLIAHGARPGLPAAIIENGTRRTQRVAITTLEGLSDAGAHRAGPALLIIGEVVSARVTPYGEVPTLAAEAAPLKVLSH